MSRHGTAGKKRTGSIRPRGRPNEGRRVLSRLQGHESRPMRASSSPIFRHVPSHRQPLEVERCPVPAGLPQGFGIPDSQRIRKTITSNCLGIAKGLSQCIRDNLPEIS